MFLPIKRPPNSPLVHVGLWKFIRCQAEMNCQWPKQGIKLRMKKTSLTWWIPEPVREGYWQRSQSRAWGVLICGKTPWGSVRGEAWLWGAWSASVAVVWLQTEGSLIEDKQGTCPFHQEMERRKSENKLWKWKLNSEGISFVGGGNNHPPKSIAVLRSRQGSIYMGLRHNMWWEREMVVKTEWEKTKTLLPPCSSVTTSLLCDPITSASICLHLALNSDRELSRFSLWQCD